MANINKIALPDGTQYDIEDAVAREKALMIVNVTKTYGSQGEETYSSDKTHAEILSHLNAGGFVILDMTLPSPYDENAIWYYDGSYTENDYSELNFIRTTFSGSLGYSSNLRSELLTIYPNNNIVVDTIDSDIPSASNTVPSADGTATAGSSSYYARADHVHPTDTSRAPLASPAFTGTPTAPTATSGTNTTQIATTAFVHDAISNIGSFNVQIVQTLPTTNIDTHTIYFVPISAATVGTSTVGSATVGAEYDVYEEYMYINNQWEKIGDTRIDLSGYATKQYVDSAISGADSDIFWVHFTESSESGILVADKTFAELTAAWSSGKLIQATYYGAVYQISNTFDGGYENFAEFKRPVNVSSDSGITSVSYNTIDWEHQENNDTIYYIGGQAYTPSIAYPSYPGFSNGQILQYNSTSGKWEATNLPSIPTVSISMSNNIITLSQGGTATSTIALPVYSGSVSTVGGGS